MSDAKPLERLLQLVEPWEVEEGETLLDTRLFALRTRRAASRTTAGKRGDFVYLDSVDWVNVVAVTDDDHVVTIEQFRHGTKEVTLEIPGGMCDPGEDAIAAGVRELREETGYVGTAPEVIGVVSPNPAIQNNRCHTVLVRGVERRHELELDGNEEIAVRLVSVDQIWKLLRDGTIHHALVVSAFLHYRLHVDADR